MGTPEPDSDIGRRLHPRVPANLWARLVTGQQFEHVFIESLSTSGAGLCLESAATVGMEVMLSWQAHDIPGTIVWARGRKCGLAFDRSIQTELVAAIVQASGIARQELGRSVRHRNLG